MLRRLAFAAAQFHRLEDDLAFELLDLKFEVLLGALIGGALNDGGLQSLRLLFFAPRRRREPPGVRRC
jgi:hypothetical protein